MFLIILSTITASLCLATAIHGFIAFRQHQRDAVTIEEGLGVIRWRLLSREHLQTVLVVLISGLVSGMAAMAFYWGGRMAWVSEMISFAYIAIACVFLVVPWLRRMSMDQVVRYLEKQSVPNIDAQNRQGNLKQLMRTYLYYHKTTTQPALFDWIRRQLSLYMLGIDVRSHIPFSIDSMIRRAVKMLLYVAVLTLFLFLTRDKENAWEGFEIADGELPAGDRGHFSLSRRGT